MPGIAQGLCVLELATVLAGPAVGAFWAEMGARVIKVEPPAGDVTRTWLVAGEQPREGASAYFAAVNWGKESVVADLRTPDGRALVHRLAGWADMVIANYKPGDAEKLGVDYATLAAQNPRLIYGHLTGYGPDNPRLGYDAVVQAEAGFMALNGEPHGPPLKLPVALMDLLAAHLLKEGLLLALWQRERTGRGAYVPVSLAEAGLTALANQAAAWQWAGLPPQRLGSEHPSIVPYGTVFYCLKQEPVLLAVGTDAQFADLCQVIAQPGLASDPRFLNNAKRVVHRAALIPLLAEALAKWPRAELLARLMALNIPAGAVLTVPEALQQPWAPPLLLGQPGAAGLRTTPLGAASGWQNPHLAVPPTLGQHTAALRQELGL